MPVAGGEEARPRRGAELSSRRVRPWLYAALVAAYLLHNDLWLWEDARLVAGLPVGLAYHAGFCLVVAGLMALLVRYAWPADGDR